MSRVADGGPSRPTSRSKPRSSGRRDGQAEDRSDHRLDPPPARSGAGQGVLEGGRQLGGGAVDERFEQGLFRGEPVEDGLLAHAEALGQGVERGRLVATGAERRQGRVEDAVGGAALAAASTPCSALSPRPPTIW